MSEDAVFALREGPLPLLISVPHDGRLVPPDIQSRMTPAARNTPDTDWHVAELYDFANELGANVLLARYSRYVVDLNRSSDDAALYAGQVSTGLCPVRTFAGDPIYTHGYEMDAEIRDERVRRYWRPYHTCLRDTLAGLRKRHGIALLWDAHSIASVVPRLFAGRLPELNIGTNGGASCPRGVERAVCGVARRSGYSLAVNGRFRGGFITRHYGNPDDRCYALQLEIAQRCYMDEKTVRYDADRAARLRDALKAMLLAYVESAQEGCGETA